MQMGSELVKKLKRPTRIISCRALKEMRDLTAQSKTLTT